MASVIAERGNGEEEGKGETKMRIYVGGVGESVNCDDLRKVFSSFGKVDEIDFVRTKGRSFAYVDFLPSSDNALSKLFSTFNGCVWKGGRLRLEKAKEHYIARLKREWAEDAELAGCASSNGDGTEIKVESTEKSRTVSNLEKRQIRIFFPKLGKIKSLPFSGSGKHKYSFPRVEVSSPPKYFCDCEEHSDPLPSVKEKLNCDIEAQGMNEEELDIMNIVMKKLFDGENALSTPRSSLGLTEEEVGPAKMMDNLQSDDNEADDAADGDDILINMVTRVVGRKGLLETRGNKPVSPNQTPKLTKSQTSASKTEPIQDDELEGWKAHIEPPGKKRKSLHEINDGSEPGSTMPRSKVNRQTYSNDSESLVRSQPSKPESGSKESTSNISWFQKSSWRKLVGDRGKTAFSFSNILPDVSSTEKERSKPDGLSQVVANSADNKSHQLANSKNMELQLGRTQVVKPDPHTSKISAAGSAFPVSSMVPDVDFAREKPSKSDGPGLVVTNTSDNTKTNLSNNKDMEEQLGTITMVDSKTSAASTDLGRASSWFQKCSWKQLVGGNNNASFSITQILPGEMQELTKASGGNTTNFDDRKSSNLAEQNRSESTEAGFTKMGVGRGKNVWGGSPEKPQLNFADKSEPSASVMQENRNLAPERISIDDVMASDTCSFMRNAASLKEWAKAKAALSGTRKRKSSEK